MKKNMLPKDIVTDRFGKFKPINCEYSYIFNSGIKKIIKLCMKFNGWIDFNPTIFEETTQQMWIMSTIKYLLENDYLQLFGEEYSCTSNYFYRLKDKFFILLIPYWRINK